MKAVKKIYRGLTWAADLEAAVAALSTSELRKLNRYLHGTKGGIPALIHGLVCYEASGRLLLGKEEGKVL